MKKYKIITIVVLLFLNFTAYSQNKVTILSSDNKGVTVKFSFNESHFENVSTSLGDANLIRAKNAYQLLEKSTPDVLKMVASIMLPSNGNYNSKVLSSQYIDIDNVLLAPSKGNLLRSVDPKNIAYEFGESYNKNEFYPKELIKTSSPYIIRNTRGIALDANITQYNPVLKKLRIYSEIFVRVDFLPSVKGENEVLTDKPFDNEFSEIYKRHFANFKSTKYTSVNEEGKMLIICHDAFLSSMEPFVQHKLDMGITTTIVAVSTIGADATSIKAYIQNQFDTNNLKYVLLVGDHAQVPTNMLNIDYSQFGSDNTYSYLAGDDHYPDIFVGRFSAETESQVNTMVERTITYETNPASGDWLKTGIGIASNQGPGDNNEYDWEHLRIIRSKLMGYNYTNVAELYDGNNAGGVDSIGNPTINMVSNAINSGVGVINYTGHGNYNVWGTTGFSNSNIDALQNESKCPFIISVACYNGDFTSQTCFAEKWTRATYNGKPIGAVAALMSSISQPWDPPMKGQDEMNDILSEAYTSNIKRTFGGITMNGCMAMNDTYTNAAINTMDTWNLFGDPSLMVRTNQATSFTVTHPDQIIIGSNNVTVYSPLNGARVSLKLNNQLIGTGIINNDSANISFTAINNIDTINVIASAYNKIPYYGIIKVKNNNIGINNIENIIDYSITPNPAKESFFVNILSNKNETISIELIDITGKIVLQQRLNCSSNSPLIASFDVSKLNDGVYFLKMLSNNINKTSKIIISN